MNNNKINRFMQYWRIIIHYKVEKNEQNTSVFDFKCIFILLLILMLTTTKNSMSGNRKKKR